MDTKRLIWVTILSLGIMTLWMFAVPFALRQAGYDLSRPPVRAPVDDATTRPVVDPLDEPAATLATGDAATTTRPAAEIDGALRPVNTAQPRSVVLGSAEPEDDVYAMRLTLTNVGAGVEEALLNRYRQSVDGEGRYVIQKPYDRNPTRTRPLATDRVTVAGQSVDLAGVAWNVDEERTNTTRASFYLDLAGPDGEAVARVGKTFEIFPRESEAAPGQGGYEVRVVQTIRNLTGEPIIASANLNGTTTPPRELEYGYDRTVIVGYRGRNGTVDYTGFQAESFTGDERRQELLKTENEPPLLWAGTGTIYFNAIVRPLPLTPSRTAAVVAPNWLRSVVARGTRPARDDPADIDALEPDVLLNFETADLKIPPGKAVDLAFAVALSPKDRSLLKGPYYAAAALRYDETLISPFGCTWCVFQPVVDALVFLLTSFHFVLRDWGLAIIALVVVVRLLLHPINRRAQRSMMRMGKLGPEMERLKKKYGDDKDAMAKAMREFYAEHGLAALPLGCVPMLLQTPIWIALYSTLQAEFRLRHEPFLEFAGVNLTWIEDLARPDNLIDFGRDIPLLFFTIHGFNLLPILLAGVFYLQTKYQPTPATMTPEQEQQQKIMKWLMVLMFPIFLYKAPSGLNLYIITSTLIGIWETKRIRAQLKAEEEAEAANPKVIEASSKPRGGNVKGKAAAVPATGWRARVASFQEKLQAQVEQAQRDQAKRSAKGKR